ncbi:aromatic-ring-hydroxylating dioxygenase subunit beta [Jatrophihabitans sp. YIM 134969]
MTPSLEQVAPRPAPGPNLWSEIMNFYIAEAWLLDDRRLREWLDLFTDDMVYFMPRRKNVMRRELSREVPRAGTDLPFFEDDRQLMEVRVQRLESGAAWAEEPPSRTRHLVGNLVIEDVDDDDTVHAKTAFICHRSHGETDSAMYSGYRQDLLRPVGSSWKIAHRTVVLDANVILDKNLAIFF